MQNNLVLNKRAWGLDGLSVAFERVSTLLAERDVVYTGGVRERYCGSKPQQRSSQAPSWCWLTTLSYQRQNCTYCNTGSFNTISKHKDVKWHGLSLKNTPKTSSCCNCLWDYMKSHLKQQLGKCWARELSLFAESRRWAICTCWNRLLSFLGATAQTRVFWRMCWMDCADIIYEWYVRCRAGLQYRDNCQTHVYQSQSVHSGLGSTLHLRCSTRIQQIRREKCFRFLFTSSPYQFVHRESILHWSKTFKSTA